jgi:hypothetical protein
MSHTRVKFLICLAAVAAVAIGCKKGGDSGPTGSSPITPAEVPITNTGTGTRTYTYTTNIQPILVDCLPCHGPQIQNATYNFSTYAGVLRALTPGNDLSPIVRMTQPQGPMFVNLTGDRNTKSGIIYDWVVNSGAAQ